MTATHEYGEELSSLGLDDEMEDIELGSLVALELAMEQFVTVYSREKDRRFSMLTLLMRRMGEKQDMSVWVEPLAARYDQQTDVLAVGKGS